MNPIVVKIGGSLIASPEELASFWKNVSVLRKKAPVVIVHGGGKQATELAKRLGHTPEIVQGRRVTSDLDLKTVHWAMCGKINTELVAEANMHGLSAVGLTGADANMLRVTRRPPWDVEGETVDFGWVGDVAHVNTDLISAILGADSTPVIAPLGFDEDGATYNVNADTVSAAIAKALPASELLFVTETGGLCPSPDIRETLKICNRTTYESGVENGWITGGMRVKLRTGFEALESGVNEVCILAADDLVDREQATKLVP